MKPPMTRRLNVGMYAAVLSLGVQRRMEYRLNALLESLIGLGSFLVVFFLWSSVYAAHGGGEIQGMSLPRMLAYALLSRFWDWAQNPGPEVDEALPDDVRGGGLSRVLTRPMSDRWYRLSLYLSHRLFLAAVRLPSIIVVLCVLPGPSVVQPRPEQALLLLVLPLSLVLQFTFSYAVALASFWFLSIGGLLFLKRIAVSFLAGAWIPLMLLPTPVQEASRVLPFEYLVYFPVRVALGGMPADRVMTGCLVMAGWTAGLWLLGAWAWRRGLRRFTAAGI
jgi:ABC-2 type transport system permease protein